MNIGAIWNLIIQHFTCNSWHIIPTNTWEKKKQKICFETKSKTLNECTVFFFFFSSGKYLNKTTFFTKENIFHLGFSFCCCVFYCLLVICVQYFFCYLNWNRNTSNLKYRMQLVCHHLTLLFMFVRKYKVWRRKHTSRNIFDNRKNLMFFNAALKLPFITFFYSFVTDESLS